MVVTVTGGVPTETVEVRDVSGVGQARRAAAQLAARTGFSEVDAGRVALVATELATNLQRHAGGGALHLRPVAGRGGTGVEVVAIDRGPGFDAAACLRDGYSTGGTQGIGLGSIRRQTGAFDLYADPRGAVVMARVYPRGVTDRRFGISQHALPGEIVCGDGWALAIDGDHIAALVIDGLGHGEAAAAAACAGVDAFVRDPFAAPGTAMGVLHRAMAHSRGGAAAIALFRRDSGVLAYAGIGNIGGSMIGADGSRGLTSHPGILGVNYRRAQVFDYPHGAGRLLLMYSDGLQSRWRMADYPGLLQRHPAVVVAVLQRDFTRGRDDVTLLAVTLEAGDG